MSSSLYEKSWYYVPLMHWFLSVVMYAVFPSCREGDSACIYKAYIYLSICIQSSQCCRLGCIDTVKIKCSSPGNSKSVVTNCCMLLLILNIESVNFWQNIYWKKPCISSHDTALQLKFSILTSLVHFKFYVVIKMTCLSTNWHTYCKLTVYYSCSNMQDRLTQIIILLSIMICMMIWSIIIIYFEEWSY